jgi:hypothetical protein
MFKNNKEKLQNTFEDKSLRMSSINYIYSAATKGRGFRHRLLIGSSIFLVVIFMSIGVMARWGVLADHNSLDAAASKADPAGANAVGAVTATPQLSREHLYAGGRLVAIEDAASGATPTPTPTGKTTSPTSGTPKTKATPRPAP